MPGNGAPVESFAFDKSIDVPASMIAVYIVSAIESRLRKFDGVSRSVAVFEYFPTRSSVMYVGSNSRPDAVFVMFVQSTVMFGLPAGTVGDVSECRSAVIDNLVESDVTFTW